MIDAKRGKSGVTAFLAAGRTGGFCHSERSEESLFLGSNEEDPTGLFICQLEELCEAFGTLSEYC